MSAHTVEIGEVKAIDDTGLPNFQVDVKVEPPFYPGPKLGSFINLMGCQVELISSTAERSHLLLQSEILSTRAEAHTRQAAEHLRSYILQTY